MEVNVIKYRKMRAIIFYSLSTVLLICLFYDFFWFENFPGEFLNWLGVHLNPVPKATQVIFAIMFAAIAIAWDGYHLSLILESIERHADDDEFFKMRRNWVSYLIEGRTPVKSNWKPDKTALPLSQVKALFNKPGRDEIFDENLQLKTSMAAFVRFTVDNHIFETYNIDTWRKIDGIFRNKKGDRLTADQLAQCNSDIQQRQRV